MPIPVLDQSQVVIISFPTCSQVPSKDFGMFNNLSEEFHLPSSLNLIAMVSPMWKPTPFTEQSGLAHDAPKNNKRTRSFFNSRVVKGRV